MVRYREPRREDAACPDGLYGVRASRYTSLPGLAMRPGWLPSQESGIFPSPQLRGDPRPMRY